MALSCSKKLPKLLKGITSKHHGDFCCFNSLHAFRTGKKLKRHEKICKNKDICRIAMPS